MAAISTTAHLWDRNACKYFEKLRGSARPAEVLTANSPGEAVGILAGLNMPHHFHPMEIDNGNITVRCARHKCACPVGLHDDAGCAVSDCDSLDRFSSCGIDDGYFGT